MPEKWVVTAPCTLHLYIIYTRLKERVLDRFSEKKSFDYPCPITCRLIQTSWLWSFELKSNNPRERGPRDHLSLILERSVKFMSYRVIGVAISQYLTHVHLSLKCTSEARYTCEIPFPSYHSNRNYRVNITLYGRAVIIVSICDRQRFLGK